MIQQAQANDVQAECRGKFAFTASQHSPGQLCKDEPCRHPWLPADYAGHVSKVIKDTAKLKDVLDDFEDMTSIVCWQPRPENYAAA